MSANKTFLIVSIKALHKYSDIIIVLIQKLLYTYQKLLLFVQTQTVQRKSFYFAANTVTKRPEATNQTNLSPNYRHETKYPEDYI